jgi:hypothetical protein
MQHIFAAHQLQAQYNELGDIHKKQSTEQQQPKNINLFAIDEQSFLASLYKSAAQYKIKICSIEKRDTKIVQQSSSQIDYECSLEGTFAALHDFIATAIVHNQACSIHSLIVSAGSGGDRRTISMKVRYICTKSSQP